MADRLVEILETIEALVNKLIIELKNIFEFLKAYLEYLSRILSTFEKFLAIKS